MTLLAAMVDAVGVGRALKSQFCLPEAAWHLDILDILNELWISAIVISCGSSGVPSASMAAASLGGI